jgi:hypothetical protein
VTLRDLPRAQGVNLHTTFELLEAADRAARDRRPRDIWFD